MAAEESNGDHAGPILDSRYQAIVIAFDVEHDPTGLENARFRVRCLDVLRIAPIGALDRDAP
jgi:hypothetical protein